MKIAEAAAAFGVAVSTWGHWETGRSLPSGDNLLLLSEFVGIPLQHFVCPYAERCAFLRVGAEKPE